MFDFIQQNTVLTLVALIAVFGSGLAYITHKNQKRMIKIIDDEFVNRDEMTPILKVIANHTNDIQALKERD